MNIILPDGLKCEVGGYNYLLGLIDTLKEISSYEIKFDFINVKFMEANLCALLGTIIEILESRENEVSIVNVNGSVRTILSKNEFLVKFGYDGIEDQYDTAVKYRKFTPKDDISFSVYIQKQLLSKKDFPSHSMRLGKEITRNIFEIYENARTHGKCDYIHTCGQFYPKKADKPLQFTIVDKGINIWQNVSTYLKEDISASDAIEWAMKKGNTTKTGLTSGGLGLAVIFEFIKLNRGRIQVISSDGFYEFKNGNVVKVKLNSIFDGTIVNIKFNLNDNNYYYLKEEEEEDFENIF